MFNEHAQVNQLFQEFLKRFNQIFHQLELVVIHVFHQVHMTHSWTNSIHFLSMRVWNQRVFHPVQKEDRTLGFSDRFFVFESFVDQVLDETAGPAEQVASRVLDARVATHDNDALGLFPARQVADGPATHGPSPQNDIRLFDSTH